MPRRLVGNTADNGGRTGDSSEDGSLFKEVAEWLTREREEGESQGECPLNTENMDI
jgi:hypothetical protein